MTPKLLDFTPRGDKRGSLVALEDHEVGFKIRRVYHIFNTAPGVTRGLHAHRDLRQVAVAVTGSCTFLLDDGQSRETVVLDSPIKGLAIDSMVWREMFDFSADCVLLVLASNNYDETDYIRDYEQFRREASELLDHG